MATSDKPLVQLDVDGEPAVLNYNVPEPTSYSGRNLIKLDYDPAIFVELIGATPLPEIPDDEDAAIGVVFDWVANKAATTLSPFVDGAVLSTGTSSGGGTGGSGAGGGGAGGSGGGVDEPDLDLPKDPQEPKTTTTTRGRVARTRTSAALAAASPAASPATPTSTPTSTAPRPTLPRSTASMTPIRATVESLAPDAVAANLDVGKLPYVIKTATGGLAVTFADVGELPAPGIYLVETYRLSNFLGDYGAGRTVGTFSLLPGEKTKISITTYKNSSTTESATSSIFDSYSTSAEDSLESSIQSENSDTESKEKTTEWNVEAEASASWGVASASVSGGASGSTNTAREEFAKNVSAATEKHAQTASAQRDVTVNSTTTSTVETGQETAIEREIQNINVSRALNFVFRQLNQEHISLLHLVDVRVGFFNGYVDTKMEVPIHDLDKLLDYCIRTEADRATVKADILYSLRHVFDYEDKVQSMLVTPPRTFTERDNSKRTVETVARLTSTYDPDGRNITVDGIILSARSVVLRTDAVIIEALLGQANALDDYSIGLQLERVREKQLANDAVALEIEERRARLGILAAKDATGAGVWQKLYPEGVVEDGASPEPSSAGSA